jgi:hypothetical protein
MKLNVGRLVYPDPALTIVSEVITPALALAVITAPEPPPPVIPTLNELEYPVPPLFIA